MHTRVCAQVEGRGSDCIVLWLDCDKEGENICFEVRAGVRGPPHWGPGPRGVEVHAASRLCPGRERPVIWRAACEEVLGQDFSGAGLPGGERGF